MNKRQFINRVRSLFNIDGYLLPELTKEQQLAFVRDPVRYFIGADEPQSDAIMREVEKRQSEVIEEFKALSTTVSIMGNELPIVGKLYIDNPSDHRNKDLPL